MARKIKKNKSFKLLHPRWGKLGGLVLLIIVAALVWALLIRDHNASTPTTGNPASPTTSYVNLSPPTAQEKQDAQNHKSDLLQTPTPTPTTDGKRTVTPVITYADQNTINGYVSGIFEDGGTCTATITNTSTAQTITKTSQGFENASYTSCAPIDPALSSGKWKIILSYSSSAAAGASSPTTIEVP